MRVQARHHAGAARNTNRSSTVGVLEDHPLVGDPVQVRGFDERMPGEARVFETVLVRADEHNVGACRRLRSRRSDRAEGGCELAASWQVTWHWLRA